MADSFEQMTMLDGPQRDSMDVRGLYTALRQRLNRCTVLGFVVAVTILLIFSPSLFSVRTRLPALHTKLPGSPTTLDQVSNRTLGVSEM